MYGKHNTAKRPDDPTYNKRWSGVAYEPHCDHGCLCPDDNEPLHVENGAHYCPICDDYKHPRRGCPNQ